MLSIASSANAAQHSSPWYHALHNLNDQVLNTLLCCPDAMSTMDGEGLRSTADRSVAMVVLRENGRVMVTTIVVVQNLFYFYRNPTST